MKKKLKIMAIFTLFFAFAVTACGGTTTTYTVMYDGNTNTGGTVPIDTNTYLPTFTVTVLGNGTLTKTGYIFAGWNASADGTGIDRAPSSTFIIDAADVILYAKWTADPLFCGNGDTSGLISYWKLNEISGTTAADSFSGYTGTLTYASPAATVPTFTTGKASNAISLSNGQYVTVPHNAALNITDNLTIAIWVNPNSVTCSGADPAYVLVSKRSSNIQEPYEFMIGCGGSLRYTAWGTNILWPGAGTATGLVTTGSWQHVAMTRSYSGITATVTFYINGVSVGSTSQDSGPTLINSDPVWISRSGYFTQYTSQGSYSGLMDEIAIFNRALSSSEISNLYNLTNTGSSYCQ